MHKDECTVGQLEMSIYYFGKTSIFFFFLETWGQCTVYTDKCFKLGAS